VRCCSEIALSDFDQACQGASSPWILQIDTAATVLLWWSVFLYSGWSLANLLQKN
jgi:hypothetical protein